MPDLDPQVQGLVDLGLTRYEAKAYLALVPRETATAAELAAEAGIPRQRVYDVLASLVSKGLVRDRSGPVTRFAALDPNTALGRLIAVKQRAFADLQEQAGRLASDVRSTWSLARDGAAAIEYVEVVREPALLAARLHELQEAAERSLLMFSKAPYVADHTVGVAGTRRVVDAGGEARCVYEESALGNESIVAEIEMFRAAGEQARVTPQLPIKLVITDGQRAMASLVDPIHGQLTTTNILIDHAAMVATLQMSFEQMWQRAEPWEAAIRRLPG